MTGLHASGTVIDFPAVPRDAPRTKTELELLQLALGLKSAVKVEHIDSADEVWLRAQAAERSLFTVDDDEPEPSYTGVAPQTAKTLFVGPDPQLLASLREWSHTQREPGAATDKHAAIRNIGRALGYPSCCVEAYIAGREFPDQSLVFLRPLFGTEGPLDPLLNPAGNDELVSHVPCSYACDASIAIARRTSQELDKLDRPEWERRWARMQQPVLVMGARGVIRLEPSNDDAGAWDHARYTRADVSTLTDARLSEALQAGNELKLQPGSFDVLSPGGHIYTEQRAAPLDLPVLLRFGGPERRRARVAFVDLHRSLIDYMDTMTLPMLSGDLTHLGIANEVVRLYVDRERPDTWPMSYRRLQTYLLENGFSAAVWNMVFDADLVASLRDAGMLQLLIDGRFGGDDIPFDLVLTAPARQSFCRFWRLWCEGNDVPRVPELWHRGAGSRWEQTALAKPGSRLARIEDDTFWPTTAYVVPDGEYRPASDVWHLCVNPGCPYGKRLDDNPHFEGIEMPASASARGCSFCEEGGDYDGAPAEPTMRSLLHQLEYIAARAPHSRFILLERAVFRFLPRFLERADEITRRSSRRAERLEFFVTARTDEIVREQKNLRAALEVATARGLSINLYLVGVENFSERQLELFNKGTTAAVQVEAIEIMRRMEREFPRAFTASRDAAHGFLLFTPWTTLDDLRENAEWMERTHFWELRSEATLSKLRLYPTVPLFYKARAEGLLEADYAAEGLDMSVRLGYSKEAPWRFVNPDVAAVYRLLVAAADDYPRGAREIQLLRDAICAVEETGPDVRADDFHAARDRSAVARPGIGRPTGPRLSLAVSNACNLGCTFCNRKTDAPAADRERLARQLLDARAAGETLVVLDGAEPLMSRSLLFAARAARRAGFTTIGLETNTLGLDGRRIEQLKEAGVSRILPFLAGWDRASIDRIAREPGAADLLFRAAPAIEASGLEIQPVIPVARETIADLPSFVALACELFPSLRGFALRFFPSDGALPQQLADGPGEAPISRLVAAADGIGVGVSQVASPVVPPCAFVGALPLADSTGARRRRCARHHAHRSMRRMRPCIALPGRVRRVLVGLPRRAARQRADVPPGPLTQRAFTCGGRGKGMLVRREPGRPRARYSAASRTGSRLA